MKHSFSIEGYSYFLSPVTTEDAQFIVETRLEDAERNKFINIISPDVSLQVKWINKYYEVPDDYYFVVRNKLTNRKEGLISLYNIKNKKAEWGRWVIKKDSLASVESFYLICRMAFEQLDIDEIFSMTIADNKRVVAFHDSVNAKRIGIIQKCFTINNITYDAVKHIVDKEHFSAVIRPKLDKILNLISQRNNKSNI
ncbi:MAG: GNAT family N-acetyltransferase [Treponema sp.]|jgi:RimJ/RimL family protein N-acetyltransferase|nr:GNAT family N-acetyltransferase [Treponema sp.]